MQNAQFEALSQAGTGFMPGTIRILHDLYERGYQENIIPRFDHFSVHSGKTRMYAEDFRVDAIYRVENTSDPDDQAILFALSSDSLHLKGVYVDSYGLYHDELSQEILARLCCHRGETPSLPSANDKLPA
jgi:hypothetical protein